MIKYQISDEERRKYRKILNESNLSQKDQLNQIITSHYESNKSLSKQKLTKLAIISQIPWKYHKKVLVSGIPSEYREIIWSNFLTNPHGITPKLY